MNRSIHLEMAVSPPSVVAGRKVAPLIYMPEKKTTPPNSERVDRASFSSTKESHVAGIAQTFTESKTSSYLRNEYPQDEDAILDDSSSGSRTPPEFLRTDSAKGMLTNPHSSLHAFVCPCDGFKGWKAISVRGRIASKSSGDLKGLARWNWDSDVPITGMTVKEKGRYPAGRSPLELLPMELLGEFGY